MRGCVVGCSGQRFHQRGRHRDLNRQSVREGRDLKRSLGRRLPRSDASRPRASRRFRQLERETRRVERESSESLTFVCRRVPGAVFDYKEESFNCGVEHGSRTEDNVHRNVAEKADAIFRGSRALEPPGDRRGRPHGRVHAVGRRLHARGRRPEIRRPVSFADARATQSARRRPRAPERYGGLVRARTRAAARTTFDAPELLAVSDRKRPRPCDRHASPALSQALRRARHRLCDRLHDARPKLHADPRRGDPAGRDTCDQHDVRRFVRAAQGPDDGPRR